MDMEERLGEPAPPVIATTVVGKAFVDEFRLRGGARAKGERARGSGRAAALVRR